MSSGAPGNPLAAAGARSVAAGSSLAASGTHYYNPASATAPVAAPAPAQTSSVPTHHRQQSNSSVSPPVGSPSALSAAGAAAISPEHHRRLSRPTLPVPTTTAAPTNAAALSSSSVLPSSATTLSAGTSRSGDLTDQMAAMRLGAGRGDYKTTSSGAPAPAAAPVAAPVPSIPQAVTVTAPLTAGAVITTVAASTSTSSSSSENKNENNNNKNTNAGTVVVRDVFRGRDGKPISISYAAERVIGNGSFGIVYQATALETNETVAIKKVLQDKRFKNRELQILCQLDHPTIVQLKHCFYSKGEKPDEIYLNLVMEYIPETIHRTLRNHTKAKKLIPLMYTKVYMYQICRALAYIHSQGICHRDIKPQNLLLNAKTHETKLCDFGSAKVLVKGEPNVSYICSRYYRAPELVFDATDYTCAIDIWSLGCVLAELLLGQPLFPGESAVDQLVEIVKVLGTPTKEELYAMNPSQIAFKLPQIKPHPWHKVFRGKAPPVAIDLVSQFLRYDPKKRLDPFDALAHPFFDELREPGARLPNGRPLPNVFNFTDQEYRMMEERGLTTKLLPPEQLRDAIQRGKVKPPKDWQG